MAVRTVQPTLINPANAGDSDKNLGANIVIVLNQLATLANRVLGTNIITAPGLAIGSTKANVATAAFSYRIAGVTYAKAAVTAGTAPGNDVVPQSTYGAVALDIGADGTIDAIEAAANATGYASAALAIAGIPAAAAGHTRMGTVTATKSDGAFTFGTTDLDAANSTVVYTDATVDVAADTIALTTGTPT